LEPPPPPDPDRRAAEWVLKVEGRVVILVEGKEVEVTTSDELPDKPFAVIHVHLGANKLIDDASLANLKLLNKLHWLEIAGARISGAGLRHLEGLSITRLGLHDVPLTDADLEFLARLTNLQVLELHGCKVNGSGFHHLKVLRTLTVLDLSSTLVTGRGFEHFQHLSKLTRLVCTNTLLTDEALVHLKELHTLEGLILSGTKVTDRGLEHLKGLRGLESLRLARTQVTNSGLKHLRELPNLQLLDLQGTAVTDAGLEHLKALKKPLTLELQDTKITEAGLNKLKKDFPKWKVAAAPKADETGFVSIFNGKDLTGWESEWGLEQFSVDADGNLAIAGEAFRWLVTKKDYSDFVLRLEFMFAKPVMSNGGVTIRSLPNLIGANALKLEINIRSAPIRPWTGAVCYGRAAINAVVPKEAPTLKPDGNWNTLEIEAVGTRLKVTINGVLVNDVDLSKVDRSKLAPKEKGTAEANLDRKSGRIGLQSGNAPMKFRNLRVKDLSKK